MPGPYTTFVVSSYAIAALVVLLLTAWVIADHRRQRAQLRDLEARGITRRSQREAST
jgi:heme exporter protein D